MNIYVKNLKKGVVYYLTDDFYPNGGDEVKLVRFTKSDLYRGISAIVVNKEKIEFLISPKSFLFDKFPI